MHLDQVPADLPLVATACRGSMLLQIVHHHGAIEQSAFQSELAAVTESE